MAVILSCGRPGGSISTPDSIRPLRATLENLVDSVPGTVGIAFISESDTLTVNNSVRFPMMSVFKMHQALAVAHELKQRGETFGRVLRIHADSLNHHTWSPMLKEHTDDVFHLTVGELVAYSVSQSDNNASNLLFKYISGTAATDSFVRAIAPDTTFSIRFTEEAMSRDNNLCYLNYSSPYSCASLIKLIFDAEVVEEQSLTAIRDALLSTETGNERLPLPLREIEGARIAHKTGSGYRNEKGELMAFNDVGYITLPDGTAYALAVMIRDFSGTESEAAEVIATISGHVLDYITAIKER